MRYRTLIILPLALLAACAGEPEPGESIQPRRSVIVQPLSAQPLEVSIKLPVNIRPRDVFELRAPTPGTIRRLPFEKGDRVPATTLPRPEWIEADQFIAMHPDTALTDTQIARRNMRHLDGFESFAHIDTSQLEQALQEAQIGYDQAVRDLKRTEEYPQSTGAQLDQARTRRNMARAGVERILAMLHDTYVCNPAAGVLVEKTRQEGEYVNGGELIARIAVMHTVVADLEVPEAHYSALKVGDEVEIIIGSLKDDAGRPLRRTGRVALIDSVAHPQTHSFTVELHIDNGDLALPAGIFGTVRVVTYSRTDALVVPLSALKLSGPRKSLMVVTDKEEGRVTELTGVEIGQLTREWVEVRHQDLREGMLVVTFGAQSLSEGDLVTWTEKDPYALPAENGGSR
jgi:RND family efflux transporter MFP subunit